MSYESYRLNFITLTPDLKGLCYYRVYHHSMMWLLTSPGGVEAIRPCSEEPLPGCDVGKLQQPSVTG